MKKYITTVSLEKITIFAFILFTTFANAQADLPDAPDDTAAAPIDDYLWILALVAFVFVFIKLRTAMQEKNI